MICTARFVEEGHTGTIHSVWFVIPARQVSSALMALEDLSTIPAPRGPIVHLGQQWHSLVLLVSMVTVPRQQHPLIASHARRTHLLIYSIKQLVFHVEAALLRRKVSHCAPVVGRTDIFR